MAGQTGVYRGVSAEDRAAERRERLLEATLTVWADPGTRTTMTAVCAEAGLSERYFYESFRGLGDAQIAVLDRVAADIETAREVALASAGDDPAAAIRTAITSFVQLLVDDPRTGRVSIVEASAVPELRERRTALLRHFAHLAAESAALLLGGRESDPLHDEIVGLIFIGGLAELITAWLDGALEATPTELVDAASRSFIGLYAPGLLSR
ncbi:TetR/AcrR family transcriptional regulator [Nocardioides sp.]|uniref:TetR/AcrR family transcriptional regulator n=1 Tax=Nocardioides sp. TaxID=35761 RepID=UPI002B2713DC|nr:TetR/AcrR family transcriptional regulator [Nocardioides sp.]